MYKFKETALEAALKAGELLEKNFKSASTFENKIDMTLSQNPIHNQKR
jgi:hypothetical protein